MSFTRRIDPDVRFDRKYLPLTDGCWLWIGSVAGGGYGEFFVSPEVGKVPAHRWAYERWIGPIPDGLHIDHLCRIRQCVNPHHLEPVTQAENNARAAAVITHCPKGHPYTEDNLVRISRNPRERQCRACARARYWASKTPASIVAGPSKTQPQGDDPMTDSSFWDDPSMFGSDDYVKFTAIGDSVTGTILAIRKHMFDDGKIVPQIELDTPEGARTLTAGQIKLKLALQEIRPKVGDQITVILTDIEKRSGGKTLKFFDVVKGAGPVTVAAPAPAAAPTADADPLAGLTPEQIAALRNLI